MLFDTHAHLNDPAFDNDRESLLESLPGQGIGYVMNAGCSLQSSKDIIALAEKYDYFYAAAGVHPEAAGGFTERDPEEIARMLQHPKCVALGEIGLDYHYEDACPRDVQQKVFETQLRLAKELDVPVIMHDREAHGDTMDLLRKYRPKGTMHCFSGSVEMAMELVKLGIHIGLGGVVTFKNARHSVEVAKAIPPEYLLLETDAPYMSPVPFRGKRCDSSMIVYPAAKIAEVRGMTLRDVLLLTKENAQRVYGIQL
jgi:TatD DNase family protein